MTSPHVLQSGQSFTFPDTEDSYDFLFKVVLIGDAGVGKTCVVQRFKHGIYMERHGNTIGVDFMLKTIEVDGKKIKLQIWDTAGQERFRTITQSYYRGAHGVIMTYDITNSETFNHVPQWVEDVKRYAGADTLMLLIGTKLDVANINPQLRQVTLSEAKNLASAKHMLDVIETSSKEDTNIERTFVKLAKAMRKKREGSSLTSYADPEDSINLLSTQTVNEQNHWHCSC